MGTYWWIGITRAWIEVAMFSLIGQGVMAILAGGRRRENPVYVLLKLLASPSIRLCTYLFPWVRSDLGRGAMSLTLLFGFWIGLAFFRKVLDH